MRTPDAWLSVWVSEVMNANSRSIALACLAVRRNTA
jgi:hypothetical protein